MKKLEIYWTPFAVKCLEDIHRYILDETYSEKIATQFVNKLIHRVEILVDFPESGQIEKRLSKLNQNSRYLVESSYKIIYQFQEGKVIITDVFHVKQNPKSLVKRNKIGKKSSKK